jgi:DHA1 family inner membrane transport protein
MLLTGLLLMASGLLAAALAWQYGALLACRVLTGVGGVMVVATSVAMIAEAFPPTGRGRAMGWWASATGCGAAAGVPLVAWLAGVGGWRLPFAVAGTMTCGVWLLLWIWCPQPRPPSQPLTFLARYREVGAHGTFWAVLAVNALQQMVYFGIFVYLAAYLIQTYQMPTADTALPLALAGCGIMAAGVLGGRVADHRHRLTWFGLACLGSGLLAAVIFTTRGSPWATVALAGGVAVLARISIAVTPILLLERAGGSRTTAAGLFAASNQVGAFGGSALGGLMLALGGFPQVGLFCLGAAIMAVVVLRLTVWKSAAYLAQQALRESPAASE